MRIRVSIATDFSETYKFPRTYEVRGATPSETRAEVHYFVPTAMYGDWFSLKIEFLDELGLTIQPAVLRRIGLELAPKLPTQEAATKANKANQTKAGS